MANNPYVNKVQLADGTSLIDISDTTATTSDVLTGRYFYTAAGQKVQGTNTGGSEDGSVWQDAQGYVHLSDEAGTHVEVDSLNITAGGTYTAPTGHAYSPVTVASGSATTPATTVTANPSISVNSSTGVITATASATKSVTPTVSAGYVASGTAGTITVSGSNTSQLSTQAAKTVTPTESEQTAVAAGKYTTGIVKVGAISSTYVGSGITQRDDSDLSVSGATVTVPSGYYADNETATVASGSAGTPSASKGTVSNHSVSVTPSVTNTTGYITGGTKTGTAVTVSASELVSGTYSVTSAGTKDVTNYASASVPSGTEGTPMATKGTVSNHSVSVTPSVTNTTGYITGSTKTGTAVTVTASELASGNKAITQNGTGIDVVGYSTVSVDVPSGKQYTATISGTGTTACYVSYPSSSGTKYYTNGDTFLIEEGEIIYLRAVGSQGGGGIYVNNVQVAYSTYSTATYNYEVPPNTNVEISISYGTESHIYLTEVADEISIIQNGRYNVSEYDYASVNVSSGGLEYETGTWIPATDVSTGSIPFTNSHTTTPFYYAVVDAKDEFDSTTYTNIGVIFTDWSQALNCSFYATASNIYEATANTIYRGSGAALTKGNYWFTSDIARTNWVSNTELKPQTNSTSRYWRAGRTYKWIAIWAPTT